MSSILVIEDQDVLCPLYEAVLGQLRSEVVIANTGEDGLNAARRSHPDLLILDLELPGISGLPWRKPSSMKESSPASP